MIPIARLLIAGTAAVLLCGCWGSQASRNTGGLTGDARDRQLLITATADYVQAKFAPKLFGSRQKLLENSKSLFEEVLNDEAASPKSKREAADMLNKVNARLLSP